jgi:hypothetical protein
MLYMKREWNHTNQPDQHLFIYIRTLQYGIESASDVDIRSR